MSIEGVHKVIEYLTPKRINILKYCEISEEFIIQNALMESELRETIICDKLRYDDWTNCSTGPRILKIDDYKNIKKSNAFFARKIQEGDKDTKALYSRLHDDFTRGI